MENRCLYFTGDVIEFHPMSYINKHFKVNQYDEFIGRTVDICVEESKRITYNYTSLVVDHIDDDGDVKVTVSNFTFPAGFIKNVISTTPF